ncbi:MAG: hypothetical protein WCW17_00235 [Patescibacteria group bacterium]|jgi:hypothetical protein
MEKFDSIKHKHLFKDLPFSYFSTAYYLDYCGYVFENNGEDLIVWQDMLYVHDFPSIYLPKEQKNWERASIAFATPEDILKVKNAGIQITLDNPIESEFYYKTADFINPKNKNAERVRQFEKNYTFNILNEYPKQKIIDFYNQWKDQRVHESLTFEDAEQSFFFCLDNLGKYNVKQVYIESDDKLIGFAWGVEHQSGNWIGLHLKVNYSFKGLSRFLHHKRAELFADKEYFSLGTGSHDSGITQYKEELGPDYKLEYHYLLTGEKDS